MATFSQRNGRWQVKINRKGFPTQYKSFATKVESQIWARSIETAMDDGTWVDPAGTTHVTFGAHHASDTGHVGTDHGLAAAPGLGNQTGNAVGTRSFF